jgi:hypothetical protein
MSVSSIFPQINAYPNSDFFFQSLNEKIKEYERERLDCLQKLDLVDKAFSRGLYYEELSKNAANKRIDEANLKKSKGVKFSELNLSTMAKRHLYMTHGARLQVMGERATSHNIQEIWRPVYLAEKAKYEWEKPFASDEYINAGFDQNLSNDEYKKVKAARDELGNKKSFVVTPLNKWAASDEHHRSNPPQVRHLRFFW